MVAGLFGSRNWRANEDQQPSTEPLAEVVKAAMQDTATGTIFPIRSSLSSASRTKKPRVSFNTVTSATFAKDSEDPFKLSSPQERMLSPLMDASLNSDLGQAICTDPEETTQDHFPSAEELCATPESQRAFRESMSGELGNVLADVSSAVVNELVVVGASGQVSKSPAKTSLGTPVRQRSISGCSDMAISSPASVTGSTPGGSPGEMTLGSLQDLTENLPDMNALVLADEKDDIGSSNQPDVDMAPHAEVAPARDSWNYFKTYKNEERSDDEESLASRHFRQRGTNSVVPSPDTAGFVSMINKSIPGSDPEPNSSDAVAAEDVEMPCSNLPRFSVQSSAAAMSPSTQTTYDFEAVNQDFDRRVLGSSPPGPSAITNQKGPSSGASSSSGRDPRLGLLARVGTKAGVPGVRSSPSPRTSPGIAGGRFAARSPKQDITPRSPKQDFAKWAQGVPAAPVEQSPAASPGPLPGRSNMMLPLQHPITQLTGGSSQISGTRTRMSWDEFVNQSSLTLPQLDEQVFTPRTPRSDKSASGLDHVVFDCTRAQELHEMLQQRRSVCLAQFLDEAAQTSRQKDQEYNVDKNLWNQATEIPAVANELIKAMPDAFQQDDFIERMKDWYQYCQGEGRFRWYSSKKQWLEKDLEVMQQHTQTLRDDVQRLGEARDKGKEVSTDIRNGSKRMMRIGELHDIKQALQGLGADERERMQQERQLLHSKVPEEQAALEADEAGNELLELKIADLKQQLQQEKATVKDAHRSGLQQQMRKFGISKQVYAHTSIIHKATSSAVCLQFRGSMKLWVQKAEAAESVRVSMKLPSPNPHADPCIQISPEVHTGMLVSGWCRILAIVTGSEKVPPPALSGTAKQLEAAVPSHELHRFLQLLDVESLLITDQLRTMQNLRKDVPEILKFSAEFHSGPMRDESIAELTTVLSVLRSHQVLADGSLRPCTPEAQAGEFDAVQCIVKFNADLSTLPNMSWSLPTVKPLLGSLDTELVAGNALAAASHGSLSKILMAAVEAMKHATPNA